MSEYAFTLSEITTWLRSKQQSLVGSGVTVVEIRERKEYLPAATADFDGVNAVGQICAWVSGEFDFEVLRRSDDKDVFIHSLKVSSLGELELVYSKFLNALRAAE